MKLCGTCALLVFLSVIAHTAGKSLSFEVLSILPTSPDGAHVTLGGNTPLTVVFSVPVIRLGTL